MYIYVCMCVYIYVHTHTHICVCMYIYLSIYLYVCMYIYIYLYVCICSIHVHVGRRQENVLRLLLHIYMHMYICIYTCIYICKCRWQTWACAAPTAPRSWREKCVKANGNSGPLAPSCTIPPQPPLSRHAAMFSSVWILVRASGDVLV